MEAPETIPATELLFQYLSDPSNQWELDEIKAMIAKGSGLIPATLSLMFESPSFAKYIATWTINQVDAKAFQSMFAAL